MSRFHIHIAVKELEASIRFYSAIFGERPSVVKDDYAKWELADPGVNFAISYREGKSGIDHLGMQVESGEALGEIRSRFGKAGITGEAQEDTTCCYARSDKFWTVDPQGVSWETFHTLGSADAMTCSPGAMQKQGSSCCAPGTAGC